MFIHCELVILILALTLDGQVHTGEIYGGHQAVPHSRPYMVLLEIFMHDGGRKHCGGFLLNEEFVMTAAHCQGRSHTALLGVHNVLNANEIQRVSVEKTFPHKAFNRSEPTKKDIMLLKLSSKVNFSKNVRPIALAGQGDGSLPKSCIVSGWGIAETNNKYLSPVLMEVDVTITDNKLCPKEKTYCSEGERGPREGDSGGPLVCEDGKAYGVVSAFNQYSAIYVYTKIPDYRSWIDENMQHNGTSNRSHAGCMKSYI
ncbi:granzyme G-like [Pempheris klunzingeri]|uniref:granzyme G-like n=1 Tax=Pempheris klunzingeri TaxID=3127111 RepID=UPI00397E960D